MGKMLERTCRNCGNVYRLKSSASFIAFCPYCKRFDYLEREYISPVTECTVFMGDEVIGAVKAYSDDNCEYDDDTVYDISVPVIGISYTLKTKDDPLIDAAYVISEKLSKKYGFMDISNGKLIFRNESTMRCCLFKVLSLQNVYMFIIQHIGLKFNRYLNDIMKKHLIIIEK